MAGNRRLERNPPCPACLPAKRVVKASPQNEIPWWYPNGRLARPSVLAITRGLNRAALDGRLPTIVAWRAGEHALPRAPGGGHHRTPVVGGRCPHVGDRDRRGAVAVARRPDPAVPARSPPRPTTWPRAIPITSTNACPSDEHGGCSRSSTVRWRTSTSRRPACSAPADHITTIVVYDGRTIRHYVNGRNLAEFGRDIRAVPVCWSPTTARRSICRSSAGRSGWR